MMATILTRWWQPSWILPSWIQPLLHKKHKTLIQSNSIWYSNSFILTQLDDGSHLEFCHFGFSHFCTKKKIHSWLILTQIDDGSHLEFCYLGFSHFAQKSSLVHSDSTWQWQPSWTLPCWIETLPSWIQTPYYLLSDSLKHTLPPLWLCLKLIPSD